ncbi:MAG TPA: recombinase family protein [Gemmataceae bacterium]|nr:recombinase family protein [Gemmataceae bacterium]
MRLPGGVVRVALYARVSTRDKDQDPETQLRQLRQHVAGERVVGEFVDRASATDLRGRKEWRRLLELAQRRQVDLILVWRLDRAFRSVLDGASTLEQLRHCGCGLRSLMEPWIDTTSPMGEALYHITIAWAQLEKGILAERTRAGMERARADGRQIGRPRRPPVEAHRRWPEVRDLVLRGVLTRREGARRLKVRQADFSAALRKGGADPDTLAELAGRG